MKIMYIECNEEEMRANRSLMDALTDIAQGIANAFNTPISDELEEDLQEAESDL